MKAPPPSFGAPRPQSSVPPPGMTFSKRGVNMKKRSTGDSVASPTRTLSGPSPVDRKLVATIESLAREQAFDGSFQSTSALLVLLTGVAAPASPGVLNDLAIDETTKSTVWSTILTVAFLRVNFAADEGAWSILSDKALAWTQSTLLAQGVSQDQVDVLLKEVAEAARNTVVKK